MQQITKSDIEVATARVVHAAIRAGIVPNGYQIDIQRGSRTNGLAWGFLHRAGVRYSHVPFIPRFRSEHTAREVHAALIGVATALECIAGTR